MAWMEASKSINCGIWTTLEILLNKENRGKVWDKTESWTTKSLTASSTVKRVQKSKNCESKRPSAIIEEEIDRDERDTTISLSLLSLNTIKESKIYETSASDKKSKLTIRSKKKYRKRNKNDKNSKVDSVIESSFVLPKVSGRLERLMGSNVVQLTDRNYMMEMRRRINEDFKKTLEKRIQTREAAEVVRQRNLLMEGKISECPKELADHPVLMVNQMAKKYSIKKNSKLKTKRERNAEKLIRQSKKWEKERILFEEREREREAEMKIREMELLASEAKYNESREACGTKLLNIKDKRFQNNEIDLENFLKIEHDLMANRLKTDEMKFDPYKKDLRMVDAKRRLSEASRPKLKSLIAKVAGNLSKFVKAQKEAKSTTSKSDIDTEKESNSDSKETAKCDENDNKKDDSDAEGEMSMINFIDPMIIKLKEANNVDEMYALAEKIVGRIAVENIGKRQSVENDE